MALWESLARAGATACGALYGAAGTVALGSLQSASCLGGRLEALRGRAVLVAVRDPLTCAITLIELDGVARRMVLCPPDLSPEHVPQVIRDAQVDAWVGDEANSEPPLGLGLALGLHADPVPRTGALERRASCETEWVLLTSGTTGAPKLVAHTLSSLTSAIKGFTTAASSVVAAGVPKEPPCAPAGPRRAGHPTPSAAHVACHPKPEGRKVVWSTFYDIRRYGGLQIYLRGLHGGFLALSSPGESIAEFLARAGAAGVTHISGTPSHWRKALMSGAAEHLAPSYVRLSGEIADQGILEALRAAFPGATVAHAFASTEAGVGFEVQDGLAGFPASLIGMSPDGAEINVSRGTLRIRSAGNASRYLGERAPPLKDAEGFVDMGDRVALRTGRYYFVGRSGGIINVGGLKVHPEEVEAVINSHPRVRMALVKARRSPITGAVVTAEVVLAQPGRGEGEERSDETICQEILAACRAALPPHKVPALIRAVARLEVSASGKLVRPNESPGAIHDDTRKRVGPRESGGEGPGAAE